MYNKITIVTCSRFNEFEKEDFIKNVHSTCGVEHDLIFINNSEGKSLTSIYFENINKCQTDIIVFIHDDIEFMQNGWGLELVKLFENNKEYGIIGIAGCSDFDNNACWWNSKNRYGQVAHKKDGMVWLSEFSPILSTDLEEVCVIDGLFMAIERTRITRNFDTDFIGFNHYDTSFCLDNYLDEECKIGVTTNIKVMHNSIGEVKLEWFKNKELLINKFGEYLPITIKKNKYGKRT